MTDPRPLFIMGVHRSGTTWLHQMIVETGLFDYLSTFHILKYDVLPSLKGNLQDTPAYHEVCAAFDALGMTQRRIDEVEISPMAPDEYGLVLDNAGTGLSMSKRNVSLVQEMCTRLKTAPGRPLVLKNPWDCANFIQLKKLIPEARFVFIHRHPERTLHSTLNTFRDMLDSRNEFGALIWKRYAQLYSGSPFQALVLHLGRQIMVRRRRLSIRLLTPVTTYALTYFVKNIGRLDKSDYLSIRYEDLCERPSELLKKILNFAGIDPSHEVRPLTPARPRKTALLPEVEWYRNAIARKNAPYMQLHGYEQGGIVLS